MTKHLMCESEVQELLGKDSAMYNRMIPGPLVCEVQECKVFMRSDDKRNS